MKMVIIESLYELYQIPTPRFESIVHQTTEPNEHLTHQERAIRLRFRMFEVSEVSRNRRSNQEIFNRYYIVAPRRRSSVYLPVLARFIKPNSHYV